MDPKKNDYYVRYFHIELFDIGILYSKDNKFFVLINESNEVHNANVLNRFSQNGDELR